MALAVEESNIAEKIASGVRHPQQLRSVPGGVGLPFGKVGRAPQDPGETTGEESEDPGDRGGS